MGREEGEDSRSGALPYLRVLHYLEAEGGRRMIGKELRKLRESLGLSQEEAAARSSVMTAAAISRIEAGGRQPGLISLTGFARAYNAMIVIGPKSVRVESASTGKESG
jgi:transcriptional regulator with XRE-family HTH domain